MLRRLFLCLLVRVGVLPAWEADIYDRMWDDES